MGRVSAHDVYSNGNGGPITDSNIHPQPDSAGARFVFALIRSTISWPRQ